MRSKTHWAPSRQLAHCAQMAAITLTTQTSLWVTPAHADVLSINGLYGNASIAFSVTFDVASGMSAGWTHQLFIDDDENTATGYADWYDLPVRFVDRAGPNQVYVRYTLGGGGRGGWGNSVGTRSFKWPDDKPRAAPTNPSPETWGVEMNARDS